MALQLEHTNRFSCTKDKRQVNGWHFEHCRWWFFQRKFSQPYSEVIPTSQLLNCSYGTPTNLQKLMESKFPLRAAWCKQSNQHFLSCCHVSQRKKCHMKQFCKPAQEQRQSWTGLLERSLPGLERRTLATATTTTTAFRPTSASTSAETATTC